MLVDAACRPRKAEVLAKANRNIEVLRRLVRLAKDRLVDSSKGNQLRDRARNVVREARSRRNAHP